MEHDARYRLLLHAMGQQFICLAALLSLSGHITADEPVRGFDYRSQRLINQTLLRDSRQRDWLSRYEQLLVSGDDEKILELVILYQQILDQEKDSFVWTDSGELISVKTRAQQLFEVHPQVWDVYCKLFAGKAKRLFDPDRKETWKETAQRYFYTPAGLSAQKRLAAKAWDEGRFEEAASRLLKIIKSPRYRSQTVRKQLEQAYLAASLAHNKTAQKEINRFILESGLFRADLVDELSLVSQKLVDHLERQQVTPRRNWKQPRQTVRTNQFADDTPPMLEPEWLYAKAAMRTGEALADRPNAIRSSLQKWSSLQREHLFPEIASQFAVVVNDLLLFRDFDSIRAIRIPRSGEQADAETLWKFESPCPISTALETGVDPYTGINSNHPSIERLHLGNSVLGALTANDETVFLIDSVQRVRQVNEIQMASLESRVGPNGREEEQFYDEYLTNRLAALSLQNDSDTPLVRWTIDRSGWRVGENGTGRDHLLSGHYFLGPPTLSSHRAYVISERHSLVSLTALDPTSGKVLWSQPISYADRPLEYDISRATRATIPVCADGTIICDNGNGNLIAMDSVSGHLRWLYSYADEDSRQDSGRWTYTQSTRYSHAGVMNTPVSVDGRVIVLPDRSRRIQCCDIETGRLLWSCLREDAQYIAAVTVGHNRRDGSKNLLLCVATRSCRALDPENGEEIWKTDTGIISGHGVQVGDVFLLPVDSEELLPNSNLVVTNSGILRGRIEVINLANGKLVRNALPLKPVADSGFEDRSGQRENRSERKFSYPLGNLVVCQDRIISVGIGQVVSFQQAGSVSRQLGGQGGVLPERQIQQLVQAEIILGNEKEALERIRDAAKLPASSPTERSRTRDIFREILYRQLDNGDQVDNGDQAQRELFAEIEKLVTTPQQKARLLASKIESLVNKRESEKLCLATVRFTELGVDVALVPPDHQGYLQTTSSRLPALYRRFFKQISSAEKERFLLELEQVLRDKLTAMTTDQLRLLAEIFPEVGQTDPVRFELVKRYLDSGNCQQAEMVLLQLQRSPWERSRRRASGKLSEIYRQVGICMPGYRKRNPGFSIFALQPSPGMVSADEPAGDIRPDAREKTSVREREFGQSGYHVSIQQRIPLALLHEDPYSKQRLVYSNPDQSWSLLHQPNIPSKRMKAVSGQEGTASIWQLVLSEDAPDSYEEMDNEQLLTFLDRLTGQNLFEIRLPGTRFGLANGSNKQIGHLLPVVASGEIYGVSLMEGRAIWKWRVDHSGNRRQRIELGPIGQGYCIYQTVRSLVCLDPENGRLLWKRCDLEPRGGLWANRHTGLIGDEKCIVYFHADHNHYTLLDTESGSTIRKGVLAQAPFLAQRTRRAFGRKIMYLAVSESLPHQRYLRLWDPLELSMLIDEPFGVQDLYSASRNELTIYFSEGRLLIYHPEQGRTIAEIEFDAEEIGPTNYLRVARQGGCYLVNLYRSQRADNEYGYTSRFTDSPWKVTHVNGPVMAISAHSGQLKWMRSFSNRTIVNEPLGGLPILLTCATYQSRPGDQQRSLLVEILDLDTGNTLASRNDLPLSRLLLLNYCSRKSEILLSGMMNDIAIHFRNDRLSRFKQNQPVYSDYSLHATR